MAAPSSSAGTSKSGSNIDVSEAVNHLIQGKRHMLVQDYASAVSSLQSATEIFVEKYGEVANECGEAYFNYGKSLLELARMETGVLGNALDGVPEGEEEEEDKESEDSESNEDQVEDPDKLTDDEDEQDEDKEVEIDKSPAKDENDENESQDEEEKEDKEEEVTNLQLAWEVIELSKIIFERQSEDNKVMKLKTADAYLKLGEIAIESGNYHQASEDLSKCLSIQEKELDSDDRLIAETYYQLGLAFSFDSKFDEGTKHYEKALDVIKTRISNLEKSIPEESDHDKKEKITREVEELKDIIKEINSKIEDTIDMKRNAMKAQADAIKEALAQQKVIGGEEASCSSAPSCSSSNPFADSNTASSFNSFSSASPTKPVSNIGHLVKKKRKAEDNPSQLELKRVCSTDSETKPDVQTNGTGDHKDDKSQVA